MSDAAGSGLPGAPGLSAQAAALALPAQHRAARLLELALVFLGLPLALRLGLVPVPRLAVLATVMAGCLAVLAGDSTFDRSQLFSFHGVKARCGALAWRTAAAALLVAAVVLWLDPARWLEMPRQHTLAWATALLLYPALSAWPQEVIYRAFFFHRYGPVLGRGTGLLVANAVAFGALHLVYPNLVAPLLSVPAGLLMAHTFRRTGTLGPVWIEHVVYGMLLFTLGLGQYFYDGRG
jgi:hypothetical protein